MGEPSQITFSYKEIAELLVKKQGLHDGIWGLFIKFGRGASNVGPNDNDLKPAAIIPVFGDWASKIRQRKQSLSGGCG